MNNTEKISSIGEKECDLEKEPKPERVVFFIRHPSVKWINKLIEQADSEGKDMETYVPIDKDGIGMVRRLSGFLQEHLHEMLEDKDGLNQKFMIYTSPIRRAKSEAEIISKNLKLAHTDNPKIPIPKNNEPILNDAFAELSNPYTKEETFQLIEEAKAMGVSATEYLYTKDPKKIADALESIRKRVEGGLDFLRQTDTPVSFVFAHRAVIAMNLWLIEQKSMGRENMAFVEADVPSFLEIARNIPFTSISQVDITNGDFSVESVGETPHLDSRLRRGTF